MTFSMRSIAMMITQLPTKVVYFLYYFLKGHLLTFYSYLPFSLIGNLFCLILFAISGLSVPAVVRPILDFFELSKQIPASALSNIDIFVKIFPWATHAWSVRYNDDDKLAENSVE
ncbi:uncharacterized protein LOC124889536 [Capsicum annuum]|uniref:uncharacterized protein LOC124889536 n=1 Tax=Capsicum annuum TaxID=4072 RepID=UPI001FB0BA3A|nr:uncharacterized protein LOC124889536 [Capsicum annuum]